MASFVIDVSSEVFDKLTYLAGLSGLSPVEWLSRDINRAARICESLRDPPSPVYPPGAFRPVGLVHEPLSHSLSVKVSARVAKMARAHPDWPDRFRELLDEFLLRD